MSPKRPVGRKTKKLLLPAALAVAASGCSPPAQACASDEPRGCWPDGGFVCQPECMPSRLPDGGFELRSSGTPVCSCLV